MFKKFKKVAIAVVAVTTTLIACKKQDSPGTGNFEKSATAAFTLPTQSIPTTGGLISSDLHLTNDKVWLIDGIVYVTNGAELTIDPGTIISAGAFVSYATDDGSRNIRGVLVITKGSTIEAVGTASQPIVFTSPNNPGNRKAGDFGGIVVLGNAIINSPTGSEVIEGIPPLNPPASIRYGGTNNADYSGRLEYVRIEYPGYRLDADNEINGLTLGGVGSATVLDHIQVSYSADDAFEFFGGTVNAKHLVALGADDDDFDFDRGYVGNIQFALGLKDLNSTHSKNSSTPTLSDANGIESDNDATGSSNIPITRPVISNLTLLGFNKNASPKLDTLLNGARLRRASKFVIKNSVIAGYPTGVRFETTGSYASPDAIFSHNILQAYNALYNPSAGSSVSNILSLVTSPSSLTAADDFIRLGFNGALNLVPFYTGAFSPAVTYNANNLYPQPAVPPTYPDNSPALTAGTNWTNLPSSFFTTVTYRGGLSNTDNWTNTWVNWAPHSKAY